MSENKTIFTTKDVAMMLYKNLQDQFTKEMTNSYRSPLEGIIKEVVEENSDKFREEFRKMLVGVFNDNEFKDIMRDEFKHKVAKILVGKLEGEVEKAVHAIRQDQTIRARMILAIENIINENQKD